MKSGVIFLTKPLKVPSSWDCWLLLFWDESDDCWKLESDLDWSLKVPNDLEGPDVPEELDCWPFC